MNTDVNFATTITAAATATTTTTTTTTDFDQMFTMRICFVKF